jgi:predicted MFS family arabinose efflux permease
MKNISERLIISILFLVQFIDVLDFMIVMPLGPDLAADLGIAESNLGFIASSYTIAAAFSGILSSVIVDQFDRKKVLILTLSGLVMANIFSANAWNIESMLASRFLAGAFGGPATSVCFAIVADLFAANRRGEVMGKVMSGFSLAAIFGVPIGLEISRYWGWYSSFYMVAFLGFLTIMLIVFFLPSVAGHLAASKAKKVTYWSLFNKPNYLWSFLAVCCGSMAAFMIIPYVSPFIQSNMNFPREKVSLIYFAGGAASFFVMHFAGKFVDKTSSSFTTMLSNLFILFTLIAGFVIATKNIPILVIFTPFMVGMAIRNVSNFTLYSKIPDLSDRAGFMSVISCLQHIASSAGAVLTSLILVDEAQGRLEHMDIAALIAAGLFLSTPFILNKIEQQLRLR